MCVMFGNAHSWKDDLLDHPNSAVQARIEHWADNINYLNPTNSSQIQCIISGSMSIYRNGPQRLGLELTYG